MFSTAEQPPEQARVLSLTEAAALGYHVSQRGSHLVFRCPYSSPLSQSVKVHAGDVANTRLQVLHHSVIKWMLCVWVLMRFPRREEWIWRLSELPSCTDSEAASWLLTPPSPVLRVGISMTSFDKCKIPKWNVSFSSHFSPPDEATADGPDLLWTVPYVLSPLVHGQFRDGGMRMGVNGWALSESEHTERGFKIGLQEGRVEVRIPFGAHGGHLKVSKRAVVHQKCSRKETNQADICKNSCLLCFSVFSSLCVDCDSSRAVFWEDGTVSPCRWICSSWGSGRTSAGLSHSTAPSGSSGLLSSHKPSPAVRLSEAMFTNVLMLVKYKSYAAGMWGCLVSLNRKR